MADYKLIETGDNFTLKISYVDWTNCIDSNNYLHTHSNNLIRIQRDLGDYMIKVGDYFVKRSIDHTTQSHTVNYYRVRDATHNKSTKTAIIYRNMYLEYGEEPSLRVLSESKGGRLYKDKHNEDGYVYYITEDDMEKIMEDNMIRRQEIENVLNKDSEKLLGDITVAYGKEDDSSKFRLFSFEVFGSCIDKNVKTETNKSKCYFGSKYVYEVKAVSNKDSNGDYNEIYIYFDYDKNTGKLEYDDTKVYYFHSTNIPVKNPTGIGREEFERPFSYKVSVIEA